MTTLFFFKTIKHMGFYEDSMMFWTSSETDYSAGI